MIKKVLLLFLIMSGASADQFDDALYKIKTALSTNHDVYEKGMEKAHKSRLQDFFYFRENSRLVIMQSIYEDAVKNVLFQDKLVNDLSIVTSDLEENLYKAMIVKNTIDVTERNLISDYQNLKKIQKSTKEDCEENFITKLDKKYDPTIVYAIPTIRETEAGYPQYNSTFRMNLSYNIDTQTMGVSAGPSPNQEYKDETKEAVVVGGAAVIQAAACYFSAGALCQGYVFSGAALVLSVVYEVVASLIHGDRAKKFRENVRRAYDDANEDIYNVHTELKERNPEFVKELCQSVDIEKSIQQTATYLSHHEGLISRVQLQKKNVE